MIRSLVCKSRLPANERAVGGTYVYGQKNSGTIGAAQAVRDDRAHIIDGLTNDTADPGGQSNDMELYAATIHCESLPSQAANSKFAVSVGGKQSSPHTDPGNDRQSNDGASSDEPRVIFTWGYRSGPFANGFYRMDGTDKSGHTGLWPIAPTYVDGLDIHGTPIAYMDDVFGINIKNHVGGDEIVIAGDTYVLFPAHKKYSGTGAETGTSGYLGVAYKKVP